VVLALTATAAPQVRTEIVARLGMRDPAVLVGGFARQNIDLSVHSYFMDEAHKLEVIVNDVQDAARHQGHGIVYGATHKRVEHLAAECARVGVRAAPYHAALPGAARRETEQRFRDGDLDVVVATIAFGMGIDKPDIRWVFHADVSGSVDEYYQEIGRAGRDGQPAAAVLYFRREDLQLPRWFAAQGGPSTGSLATVADVLGRDDAPDDLVGLRRSTGLSRNQVSQTVLTLADAGGVTLGADGRVTVIGDLDRALPAAQALVHQRRAIARSHSETMEVYAGDPDCRWRFLLEYFGEAAPERCEHCDNDHRHRATQDGDDAGRPFPRGSRVVHPVFGEADVVGYVGSWILLAFDRAGYKRLDLDVVQERGLLDPV
jgi:ATP-dependent DNA helicase RecQ